MGVYCLDMLLMLVSTDIAFRGRIPVALSFGVAILTTRAGTLVGSVVADGFLFAPFWTTQLRTDICLVAVLLLAIIGMLFFTMADVQRLYVTPRAQRTDESLEQKCAAVAAMGHYQPGVRGARAAGPGTVPFPISAMSFPSPRAR